MDVLHLFLSLRAFPDTILNLSQLDVLQRDKYHVPALQSSLHSRSTVTKVNIFISNCQCYIVPFPLERPTPNWPECQRRPMKEAPGSSLVAPLMRPSRTRHSAPWRYFWWSLSGIHQVNINRGVLLANPPAFFFCNNSGITSHWDGDTSENSRAGSNFVSFPWPSRLCFSWRIW